MMIRRAEPLGEVSTWFLCFDRRSTTWWVRLIPGRYKHVRAFGFVPLMDLWLFFDVTLAGQWLIVARDGSPECEAMIERWWQGCDVLKVKRGRGAVGASRLGLWCVPAVAGLVGVRSGALRPDGLWRECIGQGAENLRREPLDAEIRPPARADASRPPARTDEGAGSR